MAEAAPLSPDPVVEAYKKDVDRTLLRENLKLTPTERFEKLMELQRLHDELRRAGRRLRSGDRVRADLQDDHMNLPSADSPVTTRARARSAPGRSAGDAGRGMDITDRRRFARTAMALVALVLSTQLVRHQSTALHRAWQGVGAEMLPGHLFYSITSLPACYLPLLFLAATVLACRRNGIRAIDWLAIGTFAFSFSWALGCLWASAESLLYTGIH